ncbi:phosphoglycerate mutase family protein [Ferrimonas pelagia]|uniref:Phosphoglycerate mutase family protein n=1 Tax=Ferrimonas pelagia TaxID=1177826 RepID=A0ABP9F2F9_9GAMM
MTKRWLFAGLSVGLLSLALWLGWETSHPDQHTIYLIRHSEKASGVDPTLSPCGEARADLWAHWLAGHNLHQIYSTDTRRTRQTAERIARRLGHALAVERYDGAALAPLAERLRLRTENALVVGHSNTTPALVGLLVGRALPALSESQFDKLWQVTVRSGQSPELAEITLDFDCP